MVDKIDNVIYNALLPVIDAMEQLGIPYYLGGSIISSIYGVVRFAYNVDVIADIQIKHIAPLVKRLEAEYYIDADAMRDAIHNRSSFNIIHFDTIFKIDIFLPKLRQFTQQEYLRARKEVIEEGTRPFYFSSPEDIILNKLEWYKMGDEVSTRQWGDIIGVMCRQAKTLDLAYLRQWAGELDVLELLERAFAETGINGN